MASRAPVPAGLEPPDSDAQSWFIPNDAVTDWSTEPIASGGFGEVFTASYYGTRVAAKRLHSRFNDQALVYFEREIGIWHRLSHPHILPLLGACDKDASGKSIHPFMVSPFMPNGTLLKFVSDPSNPRSVKEKLRLLYQVAAGMSYLHGNRVVHGDLKAVNVLLDASFNSVITDFGLSRTKHTSASAARVKGSSSSGGTPGYMAPEMLDDEPAGSSKNTDVFAFAMTMYEVLNDGKESWITKDNAPMKQAQIISQLLQHKRPKRFPGIPDDIWALIDRCWAHEPTDRPSFPDILVALKPYDRPVQPPAFPAADRVAVQASGIDTSRSPSQSSRLDELHFDDIADAPHLSSQLVSRAKRGDPAACLEAAKFISDGLTARHGDWKLAAQFYKAAADRGNLEACFQMAWLALIGEGMAKNDRSAFWFWQEVINKSTDPIFKPIATHMLGWMFYLGRGTQQDKQKGIKIIRENKSDEFSLGEDNCLAALWKSTASSNTSARKFFELCQLGSDQDWLCKHLMAVCLVNGFGASEDRQKAATIFEQLASDGHSDSQYWIGECYCFGGGVSMDKTKALQWLSESAGQGNSYGQYVVGVCHYWGWGVAKDMKKASEWFRKSAEQGNRSGQCWLAACYKNGYGVPKDVDAAIFWYRKSADQGHANAIRNLEVLDY